MKKTLGPIVFFGNEKLATGLKTSEPIIKNALVDAGYEIEQVIDGQLSELKPHEAKIAILAAYGQMIPQTKIDEFPLGIINIHPSLLPLHRGPTPIESVILNGDQKTGVSIMRLEQKMDAGSVFGFSEYKLKGNETKQFLSEKLAEIGAEMLVQLLPEIINQTAVALPQDESKATYDGLIKKSAGQIDWQKPADVIEREIRAFFGWPGSYTKLGDIDLIITQAKVDEKELRPGEIVIGNDSLIVGCSNKSLQILNLRPAGKKDMTASEFLRGYKSRLGVGR